jgi:AraC-like DNA-binding protein
MKNVCAHSDAPALAPALALRTVWDVDETPSYDVQKYPEPVDGLIAIRTLRGAGLVFPADGAAARVTPGTLYLIRRNRIRRYRCDGARWKFWWFEFTAAGALHAPQERLLPAPPAPGEARDFRALFALLGRRRAGQRAAAASIFGALLHRWLVHSADPEPRTPHQAAVERVLDAMPARLETGFPVPEMAAMAGMSVRAFRNAFHAAADDAPKACFERLRLGMAAELLKQGALSVSEVAYRLRFASPFHFSRAFRRQFGRPPSRLRPNRSRRST